MAVDHYSDLIYCIPLDKQTEGEVVRAFLSFFANVGVPNRIITDNQKVLVRPGVTKLCKDFSILKGAKSVYVSKANGKAERAIQSIRRIMRSLNAKQLQLDPISVANAVRIYNSQPRGGKGGYSPLEIHNCFDSRSTAFLKNHHLHTFKETRKEMNIAISSAIKERLEEKRRLWEKRNKSKKMFDAHEGDLVLVKSKFQNKSQPLFGADIFRVIRPFPYSALITRVCDGLTQTRHCTELKIVHRANQASDIPKHVTDSFGLADYSRDTLVPQTKYIKREGPTTRGREKAQSQAPLTPLNTHDDSDSDEWSDSEEPSVSFDDHVEIHEF